MQNAHGARTLTNRVTALYANRALSFTLAKDATFADLADHLDLPRFDGRHTDIPTAVYLKLATIRQSGAVPQAWI